MTMPTTHVAAIDLPADEHAAKRQRTTHEAETATSSSKADSGLNLTRVSGDHAVQAPSTTIIATPPPPSQLLEPVPQSKRAPRLDQWNCAAYCTVLEFISFANEAGSDSDDDDDNRSGEEEAKNDQTSAEPVGPFVLPAGLQFGSWLDADLAQLLDRVPDERLLAFFSEQGRLRPRMDNRRLYLSLTQMAGDHRLWHCKNYLPRKEKFALMHNDELAASGSSSEPNQAPRTISPDISFVMPGNQGLTARPPNTLLVLPMASQAKPSPGIELGWESWLQINPAAGAALLREYSHLRQALSFGGSQRVAYGAIRAGDHWLFLKLSAVPSSSNESIAVGSPSNLHLSISRPFHDCAMVSLGGRSDVVGTRRLLASLICEAHQASQTNFVAALRTVAITMTKAIWLVHGETTSAPATQSPTLHTWSSVCSIVGIDLNGPLEFIGHGLCGDTYGTESVAIKKCSWSDHISLINMLNEALRFPVAQAAQDQGALVRFLFGGFVDLGDQHSERYQYVIITRREGISLNRFVEARDAALAASKPNTATISDGGDSVVKRADTTPGILPCIGCSVLECVKLLHACGVWHHDVTLRNIVLARPSLHFSSLAQVQQQPDRLVRLIDLGQSKSRDCPCHSGIDDLCQIELYKVRLMMDEERLHAPDCPVPTVKLGDCYAD